MAVNGHNSVADAYYRSVEYDPFPEQRRFHESQARFRIAACGRRFGKSTMAARDCIPKYVLKPNKRIWLVGPTYLLGEKEFRVIWNDLIIKKKFGRDKRVKKGYNMRTGTMYIEFPWNTQIEVRSAEHPDLLVGEALDHVIMCEAAKHKKETWDRFIRPSLSDTRGSATFPSTPEGFNWFYDLFMQSKDPDLPEYESWKFPSWRNSRVYPGGREDPEILLLEKTMEDEWFKQEIGADFASFVGKIFPDFDVELHVRAHQYRPDWPNYIAWDWGYTNPLAAVEFQISPSDQIFVWRVYYKKYTTVPDVCKELQARAQPDGYKIDLMFGDPADPEAVSLATTGMGVHCWAPKDLKTMFTWLDGIMLMRQFIKPDRETQRDEWDTPTYEPSFFVDPSCKDVTKEFQNYRSKEAISGRNVPELGNKAGDHTIDALRYALLCIFKLGVQYHLSDVMGPGIDQGRIAPVERYDEEPVLQASTSQLSGLVGATNRGGMSFGNPDMADVWDAEPAGVGGAFNFGMEF